MTVLEQLQKIQTAPIRLIALDMDGTVYNNKKEKSKLGIRTPKIWFILIIIAALFAGAINVFQQFFSKSAVANQSAEFTALTYVFSAILSFAIYPIIKGKQPIYKNNKKINSNNDCCNLSEI